MAGNVTRSRGTAIHGTTVSYASQTPRIQNTSIRGNLFDLTEIGERSVSLSGGQKARLSLARSIYFNTRLEVMDEQLSAGDAHVGKRIWKQCVLGELKGRTRVIATHQLHVLPDVDIVICMKDSAISDSGLYSELMDRNDEFSELMGQYGGVDKKSAESAAGKVHSRDLDESSVSSTGGETQDLGKHVDKKGTSAANKLITEEERNTGAASTKVYAEYFKMVGWGFWTTVVMLYVAQQICGVMVNYWLSLWSAKEHRLETLQRIATSLDLEDLASCARVSQDWNSSFTPPLYNSVVMSKHGPSMESVEKNKHLIRHMTIQSSAHDKLSSARDKVVYSVIADLTLTTLDLESNWIESIGAKALSEALKTNSTLTTLNLQFNFIGDDGVQALSEALKTNSTLTTLDLGANFISEEGAEALSVALKTNSTLITLDLSNQCEQIRIGDIGAQALSEALKTNSTLTTLNLRSNFIGDDGAQALAEALKTNSTLSVLDLSDNSIGDYGVQALSEALKTNSTIAVEYP
ncbi:hypothetical protein MVEG_06751 [Podila verticillata NRRL 6337]|nr:hypothetical protein MVEG_06751 [Podila verticillata NRRL 6337]